MKIREGDTIKHNPTGETWIVATAYENGDILCAGWPCTMGRANEIELVKSCTDAQHEEMLQGCAKIRGERDGSDPRSASARYKLSSRPSPTQAEKEPK